MKFLIIFVFTLATAFALPGKDPKPRNIVVPAGKPEGRITRGNHAYRGQFPYQVGLLSYQPDGTLNWCGGSLISHTVILTAAHCTENVLKIKVHLGSSDRQYPQVSYEVTPKNIVVHSGWNSETLVNDISIIKIPYTYYSANIQPVKLPTRASAYSNVDGENAVASGWGRISDAITDLPTNLQYANFYVLPNNDCSSTFTIPILPSHLCVSTYYQSSTCSGDSGGPLVLQYSKTLIGITSFVASGGCEKNYPAVFTRVSHFLDWIEQNSK